MTDWSTGLVTIRQAAVLLGLQPITLRQGIRRGRFQAHKFGPTWVTTVEEVERYRRESLGHLGRPKEKK